MTATYTEASRADVFRHYTKVRPPPRPPCDTDGFPLGDSGNPGVMYR